MHPERQLVNLFIDYFVNPKYLDTKSLSKIFRGEGILVMSTIKSEEYNERSDSSYEHNKKLGIQRAK